MNNFNNIQIELYKYKKRGIYFLVVALFIIPILLTINNIFMIDPYAETNQSLCYWVGMTIFMNGMVYIHPIVFSYICCINLPEEINNQFFVLISQRDGSKVLSYRNKVIANIIALFIFFIFEILFCIGAYYCAFFMGAENLTGHILGTGYNLECAAFLIELCLFYCILIPLIVNGISINIRNTNKLIVSFIIVIFICRMLPSNYMLNYILPWNILKKFSEIDSGIGGNDVRKTLLSLLNAILVTIVIGGGCYLTGKNKIKKIDL